MEKTHQWFYRALQALGVFFILAGAPLAAQVVQDGNTYYVYGDFDFASHLYIPEKLTVIGIGSTSATYSLKLFSMELDADIVFGKVNQTNPNFTLIAPGGYSLGASRTVTIIDSKVTLNGSIGADIPNASLTVAGNGLLVLNNRGSYGGGTAINRGAGLVITNIDAVGSGKITVNGNFDIWKVGSGAINNNIAGSGSVSFNNNANGTIFVNGANTYTGATHIGSGKVVMGTSQALGASELYQEGGVLDLHNQTYTASKRIWTYAGSCITNTGGYSSLIINNNLEGGSNKLDGEIREDGGVISLVKSGVGTVTITGNNSYTGGTMLNGGTLQIASDSALGTGPLVIGGVSTIENTSRGALSLRGIFYQIWSANFTSTGSYDIDLGAGQVSLAGSRTVTVAKNTLTVRGIISGDAATDLTKAGPGILLLTGENTFTGATNIASGVLQLGEGGTTGSLASTSILNNGRLVVNRTGQITLGAGIRGIGSLFKDGYGSLVLSGNNTYTGGTTIQNGMLVLGSSSALGTGLVSVNGNSTLDLGGQNYTALSGIKTSANSYITSSSGASSLIINNSAANILDGNVREDGGMISLVKSGAGSLNITGNNTYTGGTTLNSGTLNIGNSSALGFGPLAVSGISTIDNISGSALSLDGISKQIWSANFTFKGSNSLNLGTGAVTLTATPTVTVAASTLTVGGTISSRGSAGLTKGGTGTLLLLGNNTYVGATTIASGLLQVGDGGATGSLASTSIVNNGRLAINRSGQLTLGAAISGIGSLMKDGNGTLLLTGKNTYTGGTSIQNGTLVLGSSSALGTGPVSVNGTLDLGGQSYTALSGLRTYANSHVTGSSGSSSLIINNSAANILDGDIREDGGVVSLVKAGAGSLNITGNNTYTGGTTLNAGTLNIGHASALGSGSLTFGGVSTFDNSSGSALSLTGISKQLWNADFTFKGSNSLNLGTGAVSMNATRTVNVAANTLTVGGAISGTSATAGLTKAGAGTLVLLGDNTYTGATSIASGLLQVGNGGTTGSLASTSIVNNGRLAINRSGQLTLGAAISGIGSLVKDGNGTLLLTGKNTYTGGTTLQNGTLVLGSSSALGTGPVSVNGTLDLGGQSYTALSGLKTYANSHITGSSGSSSLIINNSAANILDGDVREDGGVVSLVKAGAGSLNITGNNTYTGGTTLNAGTLNIGHASALGSGSLTFGGVSTVDNSSGSALSLTGISKQLWNADFTFKGSNSLNLGTGAVSMNATRTVNVAANTLTVGGAISGTSATAGLTKAGAGTLVLLGDNTYTGATSIASGLLQVGNGGTTGSLASTSIVNNGRLAINRSGQLTLGAAISGIGSLVKDGNGTLLLTGKNTYTGGTTLQNGTLVLGSSSALGTGPVSVNGTLDLGGQSYTALSGLKTYANSHITGSSGSSSLIINNSAANILDGDVREDGGVVSLVKAGAGSLNITGNNTYTGGTTLNAGTLNIGHASALGSGSLTFGGVSTVDNSSGSALSLTGISKQLWNADFTFKGANSLNLGTGAVSMNATRTVNIAANTLTVGGAISGASAAAGLTKAGAGTLVLLGDNTYTGATSIASGLLQVGNGGATGSLASTSVVNNGRLAINRSGQLTLGAAISGIGSLVKDGDGTLLLTGKNTYTGGTTIQNGTLALGNASAMGTGSLTVNGNLDLRGNTISFGALSGSGTIGSTTANIIGLTTTSAVNSTFSGSLAYKMLELTKTGAGVLTLSGANSHTLGTRLLAGGLNINHSSALGSGIFTIAGGTFLDNTSGSAITVGTNNVQNWNGSFTFRGSNDLDLGTGYVSLNTTATVTVAAGTLTVGGDILAAGSTSTLIKAGAGKLVLTGTSEFHGPLVINAGSLQIGDGGTRGGFTSLGIVNNGTLITNHSDNILYDGIISGTGAFRQAGGGFFGLSGANTYSGGTYVDNGYLVVENSKALGSTAGILSIGENGALNLNGYSMTVGALSGAGILYSDNGKNNTPVTLTTNTAANSTFSGAIYGYGITLVKAGSGTLTLASNGASAAGISLLAGGLNLNDKAVFGNAATFTIGGAGVIDNTSGSALTIKTGTQYWNSNFTFKGTNDLNLDSAGIGVNATRTVTVSAGKLTIGGDIYENGAQKIGFTKAGLGTLVLTGNSYLTGPLTISQGTLQLGDETTAFNNISVGSITNNGTFATNWSADREFFGVINGTGAFRKSGTGLLVLSGANKYTGGTIVENGVLALGNASALGSTAGAVTIGANGVLDLQAFNLTIGALSGGGIVGTLAETPTTFTTNTAANSTFSGLITGKNLSFVKTGAGALTLSGMTDIGGDITLSGGKLNINSADALGHSALIIKGVSTIDNTSGSLVARSQNGVQMWNANFTFQGTNDLDLGAGLAFTNAARTVTVAKGFLVTGGLYSSTAATNFAFTKAGNGTLILGSGIGLTGALAITAGELQLGTGGYVDLMSSSITNNGRLTLFSSNDLTYGGVIAGSGSLWQAKSNLTLTGKNTYTGGTKISSGTVSLGNLNALGASTGALTLDYGTLDLRGYSITVGALSGNGIITSSTGLPTTFTTNTAANSIFSGSVQGPVTIVKAGAGTLTLDGENYHSGTQLLAGGLNINNALALGSGLFQINGVSTIDNTRGSPLTVQNDSQDWNANFTFKGTNDLHFANKDAFLSGNRTITVQAKTLTYDGIIFDDGKNYSLTKAGAGTLVLTGDNEYKGATIVTGGILQIGNGGASGKLVGTSLVNNATVVYNRSTSTAYSGVISGTGKVVQSGTGSLALTGTNTYTGGTIVNSGTLQVGSAKALGNGNVTLNGGAIATNGTINRISIAGNLLWNADARIALTLDGNAGAELVAVTGKLLLLGTGPLNFDLNFANAVVMSSQSYLLMTVGKNGFAGLTANSFAFESEDDTLGGSFRITGDSLYFDAVHIAPMLMMRTASFESGYDSYTLLDSVEAVPEPSTICFLGLGLAACLFFLKRRVVAP